MISIYMIITALATTALAKGTLQYKSMLLYRSIRRNIYKTEHKTEDKHFKTDSTFSLTKMSLAAKYNNI